LEQAHPTARCLVFAALAVPIGFMPHFWQIALAVPLSAIGLFMARIPAKWHGPRTFAASGFLFLLVLPMPWTTPGQPGEPTWLAANWSGTESAIKVLCRAWTMLALGWICFLGLDASDWRAVCADLRLGSSVAMVVWMSGRCLTVLSGEWRQMRTAARLRGARLAADHRSWKVIGLLVGMGLIRSSARAERMGVALRLRTGDGNSQIPRRRWRGNDALLAGCALAAGTFLWWATAVHP
jgi:energy-coupling factor transporter transmembrane protein EcfT